uniref:Uncharacterized protein n=1 Tax=Ditylum brightwellii TaxID=49249 RepID=A0A7S4VDI8_9STRA
MLIIPHVHLILFAPTKHRYSAELQKIQKELLQHGGGSAKDTLVSDLKDEMSSKESKIKELESQLKLREQQIDTTKKEKEVCLINKSDGSIVALCVTIIIFPVL